MINPSDVDNLNPSTDTEIPPISLESLRVMADNLIRELTNIKNFLTGEMAAPSLFYSLEIFLRIQNDYKILSDHSAVTEEIKSLQVSLASDFFKIGWIWLKDYIDFNDHMFKQYLRDLINLNETFLLKDKAAEIFEVVKDNKMVGINLLTSVVNLYIQCLLAEWKEKKDTACLMEIVKCLGVINKKSLKLPSTLLNKIICLLFENANHLQLNDGQLNIINLIIQDFSSKYASRVSSRDFDKKIKANSLNNFRAKRDNLLQSIEALKIRKKELIASDKDKLNDGANELNHEIIEVNNNIIISLEKIIELYQMARKTGVHFGNDSYLEYFKELIAKYLSKDDDKLVEEFLKKSSLSGLESTKLVEFYLQQKIKILSCGFTYKKDYEEFRSAFALFSSKQNDISKNVKQKLLRQFAEIFYSNAYEINLDVESFKLQFWFFYEHYTAKQDRPLLKLDWLKIIIYKHLSQLSEEQCHKANIGEIINQEPQQILAYLRKITPIFNGFILFKTDGFDELRKLSKKLEGIIKEIEVRKNAINIILKSLSGYPNYKLNDFCKIVRDNWVFLEEKQCKKFILYFSDICFSNKYNFNYTYEQFAHEFWWVYKEHGKHSDNNSKYIWIKHFIFKTLSELSNGKIKQFENINIADFNAAQMKIYLAPAIKTLNEIVKRSDDFNLKVELEGIVEQLGLANFEICNNILLRTENQKTEIPRNDKTFNL